MNTLQNTDLGSLYASSASIVEACLALLVFAAVCNLLSLALIHAWRARVRRRVLDIPSQDLRDKSAIEAFLGTCGVYVILTNERAGRHGSPIWDSVYVGQSDNVGVRLMKHVAMRGNGGVARDLKAGRSLTFRVVEHDVRGLNRLERKLIDAFNATRSHNTQRGGGVYGR